MYGRVVLVWFNFFRKDSHKDSFGDVLRSLINCDGLRKPAEMENVRSYFGFRLWS